MERTGVLPPKQESASIPDGKPTNIRGGVKRGVPLDPFLRIQWPVAVSVVLFFAAPVLMVVVGAFRTTPFEGGVWTLDPAIRVFTNPSTYESLWTTMLIAMTTVALSMLMAVFFATLSTRTDVRLRGWITPVMAFIVAMPPLFYGISWALLGNSTYGLINEALNVVWDFDSGPVNIESWWGLVVVSALRSVGFQYFLLLGAFMAMDRSLEEAGRLSGSSSIHAFFFIQLPVLAPAISGVSILSLIVFLEAFDLPMMLGVPAGIYVLPTEAYSYLSSPSGPQYAEASALSLILILIMLTLVVAQYKLMGRRSFATMTGKGMNTEPWSLGGWGWPANLAIVAFAVIAAVLPVIQIILGALSPYMGASTGFGFDNFREILDNRKLMQAYVLTAMVAAIGAALAMLITGLLFWAAKLRTGVPRRVIDIAQWLPAAVPGIVLGLGVLWLLILVTPLRGLIGTPFSLVFALVITVVPLAGRAIEGSMAQMPLSLEEASWVSGAGKTRTIFAVTGRLMLPGLLNGWLLCFVVISGTLAIPLLLSSTSGGMLAVHVYKAFTAGRVELAAAMFVLLMVEILVVAALVVGLRALSGSRFKARMRRPRS